MLWPGRAAGSAVACAHLVCPRFVFGCMATAWQWLQWVDSLAAASVCTLPVAAGAAGRASAGGGVAPANKTHGGRWSALCRTPALPAAARISGDHCNAGACARFAFGHPTLHRVLIDQCRQAGGRAATSWQWAPGGGRCALCPLPRAPVWYSSCASRYLFNVLLHLSLRRFIRAGDLPTVHIPHCSACCPSAGCSALPTRVLRTRKRAGWGGICDIFAVPQLMSHSRLISQCTLFLPRRGATAPRAAIRQMLYMLAGCCRCCWCAVLVLHYGWLVFLLLYRFKTQRRNVERLAIYARACFLCAPRGGLVSGTPACLRRPNRF